MQWRDTTGYSQGDHERVPTTWSCNPTPQFRITVTSSHIYHKGEWVMHCAPWFDTVPLKGVETAEDAQFKALAIVRQKVNELAAALAAWTSR